jgi:16S rRNA (cytosine1402-N4)-methyltransferase
MKKKESRKENETNAFDGQEYHVPVMLKESMEALDIKPGGVYVDCTFGGGGHSREILEKLGPTGKLVAFDQDADAAKNLPADKRLVFIPQNFRHIHRFLKLYEIGKVDGLLADLGVSSHQFDEGSRGFSYRFDAALDMRMNQKAGVTAADILNSYDAGRLQKMFSEYGEVTNSKTLAAAIVEARKVQPFKTISDLLAILSPLSKGNPNRYYSQVFQALRIEVNEEMGALKDLLGQLVQVVKPGGRIAIITFHSLEDRIVKQFFKQGTFEITEDPIYGRNQESPFSIITKKPVVASAGELKINPRARSANLRVVAIKEK